jgi:hypothetical protein
MKPQDFKGALTLGLSSGMHSFIYTITKHKYW